jgi:hypothetical protein
MVATCCPPAPSADISALKASAAGTSSLECWLNRSMKRSSRGIRERKARVIMLSFNDGTLRFRRRDSDVKTQRKKARVMPRRQERSRATRFALVVLLTLLRQKARASLAFPKMGILGTGIGLTWAIQWRGAERRLFSGPAACLRVVWTLLGAAHNRTVDFTG